MAQTRWRPLHEAEQWLEEIGFGQKPKLELATDVCEDKKNVYVEIHAPGIEHNKIDITVHHDQLKVTGSREEEQEFADKDYYHREILRGSFERTFSLPCEVDEKKAHAEFKDGVLSIVLPKKSTPEEHKIPIEKARK